MRVKAKHNNVLMDVDLADIDIANAVRCGGWEQCEQDRIKRFLPDLDVIELGGGLGYTACYIHQKISKDKKHIVVEANNKFIPIIQHHMSINKVNFEIVQVCIAQAVLICLH